MRVEMGREVDLVFVVLVFGDPVDRALVLPIPACKLSRKAVKGWFFYNMGLGFWSTVASRIL